MHLNIQKIVIHRDTKDSIFIFTSHLHPVEGAGYIAVNVDCPLGTAEEWIKREIGTTTFELVHGTMAVIAPE